MKVADERRVLLLFLYIMPIVDTINGIVLDFFSVGQLYRGLLFIYCFFVLYRVNRKSCYMLGIVFAISCVIQFFVEISHGVDSVVDTLKLFLPILLVYLWNELLLVGKMKNSDAYRVFDNWAVWYPVTILVPYLLGIGTFAYAGDVGYKGFYYATNEISFVISTIVMYLTYQVSQSVRVKYIVLVLVNSICLFLMGTKTGYLVVLLCLGLVAIKHGPSVIRRFGRKSLVAIPVCVCTIIVMFVIFKNEINSVLNRWVWMATEAYPNPIDFLSSGRTLRLTEGFTKFLSKPVYMLFGWGLGGTAAGYPSIEMDGFDLLFGTGIIGTLVVTILYVVVWKRNCSKGFWSISFILIALVIAMWVGHVLFYGQSGMAWAMLFVLWCKSDKAIRKYGD